MIEVIEPGLLTTVQDPDGRRGWEHLGVPRGGAVDPWSARLANRLVGNPDSAALLELTLHGPTLRFGARVAISITGTMAASADGLPIPRATARVVQAGSVVRIGVGGARGWLAVSGGIDVLVVLGSRSTDLRSSFGGHEGRALRAGDRLRLLRGTGRRYRWVGGPRADGPIRILEGPHAAPLLGALLGATFRAAAQSDRAGVRLDGPPLSGGEVASMGLPPGAIQVPPDGRPIVMLADRPVTGGYAVPAVVIGADIGRIAQLLPGDEVRFERVSLDQAREAWRRGEEELAALEPLDAGEDDELGWTGSHR